MDDRLTHREGSWKAGFEGMNSIPILRQIRRVEWRAETMGFLLAGIGPGAILRIGH